MDAEAEDAAYARQLYEEELRMAVDDEQHAATAEVADLYDDDEDDTERAPSPKRARLLQQEQDAAYAEAEARDRARLSAAAAAAALAAATAAVPAQHTTASLPLPQATTTCTLSTTEIEAAIQGALDASAGNGRAAAAALFALLQSRHPQLCAATFPGGTIPDAASARTALHALRPGATTQGSLAWHAFAALLREAAAQGAP